jgi:hypothetical protein
MTGVQATGLPCPLPAVRFFSAIIFDRPSRYVLVLPIPELTRNADIRMGIPANVDPPKAQERADDFLQAAQAILKQAPNAQASSDKPTVISGHIPLPKKRPIPQ